MALGVESPAVQTHLTLLQGVINRMGNNSANCKALCATLVSTVGAISYAAKVSHGLLITIIPIALFAYLDALYLSLEKGFRDTYDSFVEDLHAGKVVENHVFVIAPPKDYSRWPALRGAFKSWAVRLPYLALLVLVAFMLVFVKITPTT